MKLFSLRTLALLLALSGSSCVQADIGNPLNPLGNSISTAASTTPDTTRSTQDVLTEAKTELAQFNLALNNTPDKSNKPKEDAKQDESNDKRARLENIVRAYEEQLANEQRLADVQQRRQAFSKEQNLPLDPSKGPPFSLTYADRLQRTAEKAQTDVAARDLQLEFLRQNFQIQIDEVKKAEADKRQTDEAIESNPEITGKDFLLRAAELGKIKLHESQANLAVLGSAIRYNEEFRNFELDQLALANTHINLLNGQINFSKEDIDRLISKYQEEQDKYTKQAITIAKYAKQVRRDYDAKQLELSVERDKPHPADDAAANQRSTDISGAARALANELEKAERLVEMEQHSIDMAALKRRIWEARYKVFNQRSAETNAAAAQVVAQARQWISGRSDLLIAKLNHEFVDEQTLANQLKGKIDFNEIRERVVYDAERVAWLAQKLDREINRDISRHNLIGEFKDVRSNAFLNLKNFWSYELFAVEDTVQIDGKSVTGVRGITVGKIVRAIIFIICGVFAVIALARIAERYAIKKYQWRPETARLARRWLHGLGVIALTIAALIWVNIPLSIFAFMGGALAIGFGFGVQNLLKNLMSGVMLLLERPIRMGDLVELDGIQGSVVNIGIRSITLRSGNGVETLVPNSIFIEQKLTNWTYSSPLVRFQFSIGVDYNSPVESVRDLLQKTLNEDPSILRYPAPEVSFDDFGADSLMFNVYYWLELSGDLSPRKVASELRFRIFKEFADSKINIAYPQRDVHLHSTTPIQVQLHKHPNEDSTG